MSGSLLQPESQVLSTLNPDGSRRWLRPRLARGRFLRARAVVGYGLIALFVALPYVRVNDRPAILLDIVAREFTFFGKTFLPTDSLLLAILGVSIFVTIFLVTALFGRVWCGWGCPQTVYMEFVYRPIERILDGPNGVRARAQPWRTVIKHVLFLLISIFIAHIFVAYFVGIDRLIEWVQGSPLQHLTAFLVMAVVTALMMFDFGYFREQMCILACPYGRFQSVMLDRDSLIISYDPRRGEPRGKLRRGAGGSDTSPSPVSDGIGLRVLPTTGSSGLRPKSIGPSSGHGGSTDTGNTPRRPESGAVTADSRRGDCVDCGLCVAVCPTGIDIRNGLQMECIGCAQCIDACDGVMEKLQRPRGLIRYSSQAVIEGHRARFLRPRAVVYPLILLVLIVAFFAVMFSKSVPADVLVLRGRGIPFVLTTDHMVRNNLILSITNRTREPRQFSVSVIDPAGSRLEVASDDLLTVAPGLVQKIPFLVDIPPSAFRNGTASGVFEVSDGHGYTTRLRFTLVGPMAAPAPGHSGGDS
jgi:polyferredoxin